MKEMTQDELFNHLIGKTIRGVGVDDGELYLVMSDGSNLWIWSDEDLSVTLDQSKLVS
jgi:hypothetical protein